MSETRAARLRRQADDALEEYLEALERVGSNDSPGLQRQLEHLRRTYLRLQEAATWTAKQEG